MTLERMGIDIAERIITDKIKKGLFPFYETFFAPLRCLPVHGVEIGTASGAALLTYARYFRYGQFIGIDAKPHLVKKLRGELGRRGLSSRVAVACGDATNPIALLESCALPGFAAGPLDFVVDDCSHQLAQARASLMALWPILRPGGFYIVEDWMAAYLRPADYGANGGLPALLGEVLSWMAGNSGDKRIAEVVVQPCAFLIRKELPRV